ncbi:(2Fe-2S)-binding protein [Streptomyces sp. NPDC018031]|uniref:(2Fe-2S)-binding protein n=1 Tax=Streptomyces sp. NPDC018031 TaxID=3365033 RepID=UPI0037A6D546
MAVPARPLPDTPAPSRGPAAVTASPLSEAYTRLSGVYPGLTVLEGEPRSGGGWVTSAELAAGGAALDAFLGWDEDQVLRDYGEPGRPDVVAGFGLHRYVWPACLLVTVPWFLLRRVPRLPVGQVSLDRARGRMTVRVTEFRCLPDDPAAALPGARVVPDEEGLRDAVREAVAEHVGPVLDAFRRRTRRGTRALWGMVADDITEGLWRIGALLGEEDRALTELAGLLPSAVTPYPVGAGFRELTGPDGDRLVTRDRAACCLFYTLRPRETCATCPRTCDTERIRRQIAS